MSEHDDKPDRRRFPWLAVSLILIVLLYPLSIGPVWGLMIRGIIDPETYVQLGGWVYSPLAWLMLNSETFARLLWSYLQLFEP